MPTKRVCPLIRKACIQERCEAWYSGLVEENGATKLHAACVEFFWKPLYLKGIAHRADGMQRAVEGMRNEFAAGGMASQDALREAAGEIRRGLEARRQLMDDPNERRQ